VATPRKLKAENHNGVTELTEIIFEKKFMPGIGCIFMHVACYL